MCGGWGDPLTTAPSSGSRLSPGPAHRSFLHAASTGHDTSCSSPKEKQNKTNNKVSVRRCNLTVCVSDRGKHQPAYIRLSVLYGPTPAHVHWFINASSSHTWRLTECISASSIFDSTVHVLVDLLLNVFFFCLNWNLSTNIYHHCHFYPVNGETNVSSIDVQ